METVEAEGNSIDEAIDNALKALGAERAKVEIEILANATRGIFGIGGKKARVRASLRRRVGEVRVAEVAPKPPSPPKPPAPTAPSPVERAASPAPPRPVAIGPVSDSPPPAATAADDPRPSRPRPARPARPERPERPTRPDRPPRRERDLPPSAPRVVADPEPSMPIPPAVMEHAKEFLGGVLERMGFPATVELSDESERVALSIQGDGSGALIGRRGQTLDALEYLVNRIVHRDDEQAGRLVVDCEQYREKRRQALEDLARRTAERVRRRGRPVTLNPMSPRDRRVVHLVLQDDPTLTTRSAGKGFMRKLIVLPRGQRRGRAPE